MARGAVAKEWVTKKIIESFGQENVILHDKKLYITTKEDGAPIQICLALTCPKTMVGGEVIEQAVVAAKTGVDFGAFGAPTEPEPVKTAEITPDERQRVQDLMKALGL